MLGVSENRVWRRLYGREEEVAGGESRVHNVGYNL